MASGRNITDCLSCRQILSIMVILGFMLNYMLRVNLSIAIVAMVIPNNSSYSNLTVINHECSGISDNEITDNSTANIDDNFNNPNQSMKSIHWKFHHNERPQTRYNWNEYEVNFVLGAFFWGYICTEVPGGRLAEVIGAKRVLGYSTFVACLITFLIPIAAKFGFIAMGVVRIILGLMLGVTWPAIHPMISHWVPPTERSKFMAHLMASTLGGAITLPMCGFLIASIGWESVFYVTGGIGLIWTGFWFVLIHDKPATHPRISTEEREYIENSIGTTSSKTVLAVPWKSILTSVPVWAIIITHGCNVTGYHTFVSQLPTYFMYILDFKIKENGILSALPYIGKYIFALTTATLADYLRRNRKLSVTVIRKVFSTIALLIPAILMIIQARFGCDRVVSVVIFTLVLTMNGAVTGGHLGNGLDIAPNFSGTIFGMANTLSSLGGYFSSLLIGFLTYNNQTFHQWTIVFWTLSVTYAIGALVFLFFGTGELQKWNSPPLNTTFSAKILISNKNKDIVREEEESIPLKETSST